MALALGVTCAEQNPGHELVPSGVPLVLHHTVRAAWQHGEILSFPRVFLCLIREPSGLSADTSADLHITVCFSWALYLDLCSDDTQLGPALVPSQEQKL